MTKEYPKKRFYSRLARREEKRNLKKAFLFGLATIVLLIILIFMGIPALIRMAVFLAEIRGTNTPVEQADNIPPVPPQFNSLPEYNKEKIFSISGFSEPSSTVEIFLNNSPLGTTITTVEGTFTFTKVELGQATNEIYATATDPAGNKSKPSGKMQIIFDDTAPKLEISQPEDGSSIFGERKRKILVAGQTEEGISLMINERLIIVGQGGNFSTDFNLTDGENLIKIVANDQAGNQTEKEVKVNFTP